MIIMIMYHHDYHDQNQNEHHDHDGHDVPAWSYSISSFGGRSKENLGWLWSLLQWSYDYDQQDKVMISMGMLIDVIINNQEVMVKRAAGT